ncbi:MAG TPA: transglycosylase SLT domain-containing protein [Pseudomonas sp.]|uniref:transglycosylase SLT domain-containing protein n=1 Tax=Pseudomonas sp. TaxID=306 RepID=UPI002C8FD9EA|nr:transglycosylase SLT domain-containing protein [Pseudomonas sp.]HTO19863.1 transglycosylase SLT domain-containing protein [Pseudomonas sp.]
MDRRSFLTTSLGALAGLTLTGARAESEFEAFRRSQQAQRQEFAATRGAEFEAYQRELAAGFAAYSNSYAAAVRERQRELAAHWRNAELSSKTRWVEYSGDQTVQRVVDFEANRITLNFRQEAGVPDRARLLSEMRGLLSTDVADAARNDPLTTAVEQAVSQAAPGLVERSAGENKAVLSELFSSPAPSDREVRQVSEQLIEQAQTTQSNGLVTISVPLPEQRPASKAREFLADAREQGSRWKIEPALILAVMHTESAFNPLARSPVPAYGLMQIVPGSAGKDATELVYGQSRVVAPSYLYDSAKNIQLGAAYLHLLQTRYLKAVKDPESRLYCAIAAYNTGAGNVARSYTGTTNINKAAEQINRLSPKANFEHMRTRLPYEETRNYLQRVASRLPSYRSL